MGILNSESNGGQDQRQILHSPPFAKEGVKAFWLSKTLWLNALATMFLVTQTFSESLRVLMSPEQYVIFAYALAVGNGLLRLVTTQPVGLTASTETGTETDTGDTQHG